MRGAVKRAGALEQLHRLEASGADYLLLAAASAVPLYTSGISIQQPLIGLVFVAVAWIGLFVSYLLRRFVPPNKLFRNSGWLQVGVAVFIAFNFAMLNRTLPGEGFPWQLAPAAFLCWLIVIGSFFSWSDGAMLFLVVPGVALFGIQSWIETAGYFEISLALFMVSVAVLLTRLHLRVMYANARAAGVEDLHSLHAGPWRAMAGPLVAVVSVLVVACFSWVAAPQIGGAVRTLTGSQEFQFQQTNPGPVPISQERVNRTVGSGPVTSSNLVVLRLHTDGRPPYYLRGASFSIYRGLGWTDRGAYAELAPSGNTAPESNLAGVSVYDFRSMNDPIGRENSAIVEHVSRRHSSLYTTGTPSRIEYNGRLRIYRGEFIAFQDTFTNGDRYYVRSYELAPTPRVLRSIPSDRGAVRAQLGNQDRIDPAVRQLARDIAARHDNDYDAVMAFIAEIASRARYNLRAAPIEGNRDRVEAFLFDTREGYCDLFASSLAVMAKAAGIHSRVVSGYLVEESSRDGNAYLIRDRHAHMWTEILFEGVGWVPFDATAYAEAVPGAGVGAEMDGGLENAALRWAAYIAGVVFGLTALALVAGSLLAWLRTRKRLSPSMRKLHPLYLRFLRLIRAGANRPKAPSETTLEYANAYRQATGNGEIVQEVAEAFDRAFFAQDEPDDDQLRAIRKQLADLAAASRSRNGN